MFLQERQKEMTLQRRRSRLLLEGGAGARNSMEFPETGEFDELISSLKTGDYFSRRKSRTNSATSRRVELSRERSTSTLALETTREQS